MSKTSDYFQQWTRDDFYKPAMMEFDGSTGYYNKTSVTTSGNVVTALVRFKVASKTADQYILAAASASGYRILLVLYASNHATAGRRNKLSMISHATGYAAKCRVFSTSELADGEEHLAFVEFDATNGTAVMVVDGVDELDTGNAEHTLTTGTIVVGAMTFGVGADGSAGANPTDGEIGFAGYDDASGLSWSDFMDSNGNPKPLDESSWTEWGAQPLFWNEHGDMLDNKGSAGNMTRNGTITVAPAERPA